MSGIHVEIRKVSFDKERCYNCPCKSNPGHAIVVEMQRYDFNIFADVYVPCCPRCANSGRMVFPFALLLGAFPALLCAQFVIGQVALWEKVALTAVIWAVSVTLIYFLLVFVRQLLSGSSRRLKEYDVIRFMLRQGWKFYDDEDSVRALDIISPAAVEGMLEDIKQSCGCEVTFK